MPRSTLSCRSVGPAPNRGRALVLLTALLAVLAVPPALDASPSARAHPFGPPQTAAVDLAPGLEDTVRVRWRVGGDDDLTLLGVDLGLLPAERRMMDGAAFYEPADGLRLAGAPAFEAYLLETVRVSSSGAPCPGALSPMDAGTDLARTGVTLLFACSGPVTRPEVTLSTLTDMHPAYRTMASGPDGQKAVYTLDTDTHAWSLRGPAATASPVSSAALQLGVVAGGLGLAGLGVLVWRRRARSRPAGAADPVTARPAEEAPA